MACGIMPDVEPEQAIERDESAHEEERELRRSIPERLWTQLRADPMRAPEHVALAAAEVHGPGAAAWVAEKRALYAYDAPGLAVIAKRRHASLARWSGAAGGVGGAWTMIPDIAALAWIQSRLVFYIAAAYGYDPTDPMRPAELLVLRDLYPDPVTARRALDGAGATVAEAYIGGKLSRDEALVKRLSKMVMRKGGAKLAAKAIPGFAIAFNAVSNERETRALADEAMRFYGG